MPPGLCSTPVHRVRAGEPGPGTRVFGSHSLQWPGFVELDDVNNVCLTYSATTRTYRVHDLCRACAGLYSVPDVGIQVRARSCSCGFGSDLPLCTLAAGGEAVAGHFAARPRAPER
jgi:hypothetical protein